MCKQNEYVQGFIVQIAALWFSLNIRNYEIATWRTESSSRQHFSRCSGRSLARGRIVFQRGAGGVCALIGLEISVPVVPVIRNEIQT